MTTTPVVSIVDELLAELDAFDLPAISALTTELRRLRAEVEVLRVDAGRYQFIRSRAEGDSSTWQAVDDAAFVSWHGDGHNFDLNIDTAMQSNTDAKP